MPLAIGHQPLACHPDEKAIADDYFVCCAQSIEEKQKKTGKTKENIFGVCVKPRTDITVHPKIQQLQRPGEA